jgi:hypothetical protein
MGENGDLIAESNNILSRLLNKVLRRLFGPKTNGVWRKLHEEEPRDLYSSSSVIRIIKYRRMRLAGMWREWLTTVPSRVVLSSTVGLAQSQSELPSTLHHTRNSLHVFRGFNHEMRHQRFISNCYHAYKGQSRAAIFWPTCSPRILRGRSARPMTGWHRPH